MRTNDGSRTIARVSGEEQGAVHSSMVRMSVYSVTPAGPVPHNQPREHVKIVRDGRKKKIRDGHAKCQRRRGKVDVRGPRTCIPWQINSARASTNEMPAEGNRRRPLVTATAIVVNEARAAVAASATAIAPAGVKYG